ncbi:MAG: GTPase Era [Paludibacteraceae bacterium]|nr:GTPase Era [Paludibacteraceae bacterium]
MHKAGFVNIIGNPNVGKSTLMNALVGEHLSIITSKAQTTRHRIMGIVNGEDFQIVYSDTPGLLHSTYRLQEKMLEFSLSALLDADILLYVTDGQDNPDKNGDFLSKIKRFEQTQKQAKIIVIINKIDLITPETLEKLYDYWHQELPTAIILPISALNKFGIDVFFKQIKDNLPESEPFFPKDQLTDKPARFFVTEIIREKILLNYQKEVPYSVEVEVDSFKEKPLAETMQNIDNKQVKHKNRVCLHISATIYCERDSQKGIIIGKNGLALKKIGTLARKDIEAFFEKPVYLQLFVKVDPNWRSNVARLKHYGYDLN